MTQIFAKRMNPLGNCSLYHLPFTADDIHARESHDTVIEKRSSRSQVSVKCVCLLSTRTPAAVPSPMRKLRLSEVGPRYLLALVSIVQFLGTVALATIAGYMVIGGIGGTVIDYANFILAIGWVAFFAKFKNINLKRLFILLFLISSVFCY